MRAAIAMHLVDWAVQAVDDTNFGANVAGARTYDAAGLRRLLGRVQAAIDDLEAQHAAGDAAQLRPMLTQAEAATGGNADLTLADAGYHSGAALAVCARSGQRVAMPEAQARALQQPYHKDHFSYDAASGSASPAASTREACPCGCIAPPGRSAAPARPSGSVRGTGSMGVAWRSGRMTPPCGRTAPG